MRRQWIGLVVVVLLAVLLSACGGGEPEAQSYTVGYLSTVPELGLILDGFKEGMVELGYTEGENLTYLEEVVGSEELVAGAQALVDADVDLILGLQNTEALAAAELTEGIPIIFLMSFDPMIDGLVENLTKPGENLTGLVIPVFDLRRFQLMLEIDPSINHVYYPYDLGMDNKVLLEELEELAAESNVELVAQGFTMETATQIIEDTPDEIGAIFIGPDTAMAFTEDWVAAANTRQALISWPLYTDNPDIVMGFGLDIFSTGKQSARLADQIFKGTAAGELPVENVEALLSVSLVAADGIGLEVPDALLQRADTILRAEDGN
ncbi:ABC transporter substrate binding protein [Chloroflexota bacterium]